MSTHDMYQETFKLLPDIYLILDHQFIVVDYNEAYANFAVLPEKKVIGKHIQELYTKQIYPQDFPKLQQFFEESKTTQKLQCIEIHIQSNKSRNQSKIIQIAHKPLPATESKKSFMIHAIKDITDYSQIKKIHDQGYALTEKLIVQTSEMEDEITQHVKTLNEKEKKLSIKNKKARILKNANKQLIELSNLKTKFIANVSHELRTPLHGILGFGKLLTQEQIGPLTIKQKEYINYIISSGTHLNLLINDLLDLTKIEAGKMEFKPSWINIEDLLVESENFFKEAMQQKNIGFTVQKDSTLTTLYHDKCKLKQIIYNYMSNAIKFTPANGHVSLAMKLKSDDRFCLSVKDNGIGISKNNLHKIFIEFHQLDDGMNKEYQGTGLGLAIVKRIVKFFEGEVGVDSEKNKGSTFYAILPLEHQVK